MDASLGGIAAQAAAVGIAGQAVHDGPADAAGLIDLEAEVVVGAGDGVVVLMDHEMRTAGAARAALVQARVAGDGQPRDVSRCRAQVRREGGREARQVVGYLDGAGLDLGGGC